MLEGFFWLAIALLVIAVVGHGLWLLAGAVVRAIFGQASQARSRA